MTSLRSFRCLGITALLGATAVPAMAATPCTDLAKFTMPGQVVKIDKVQEVPAGPLRAPPGAPPGPAITVPAHCRVDGTIDPRTGRNGKPYGIGFAVAMPKNWNGRFFFQGGGGLNGAVNPPVGAQYAGDTTALAEGFAVVSTDSGHKGSGFDATFLEDQEATLNFLYQGIGKVTVVGKEIVAKHYGRAPQYSYFVGCSTGGREAMIMSQRFPNYFDGIVAGAPAMRTNYSNLGLRAATQALNAIAPKDAQGKPQTNLALSDADRKLLLDGFMQACDAQDGTHDGLAFNAHRCNFDPQVLACKAEKNASCLNAAQVSAVKKVMAGPKASDGRQIYPGYLYDPGLIATRGLPGVLVAPFIPEGPNATDVLPLDADAARAQDARSMAGDSNAWTNLSTFKGHGGKLMFFHGVGDPWFSSLDTIQYYERLAADNGPTPIKDWSRLFLVPGMGHCSGGERTLDRFDMVSAIVNWVEKGQAPASVKATGASMPGESRPLCPYPAHAQYNGSGDAKDAANYSCRE